MKVAFLDRDGVINQFSGTPILSPDDVRLLAGVPEAIRKLNDNGFEVIVVSNQPLIGLGLLTQETLDQMTRKVSKEIEAEGGRIAAFYYCPHKPQDNCSCRKPRTGLLQRAVERLRGQFDRDAACFIGDQESDVQLARSFGISAILVLSGIARREDVATWAVKPDRIEDDLRSAVEWVVSQKRPKP